MKPNHSHCLHTFEIKKQHVNIVTYLTFIVVYLSVADWLVALRPHPVVMVTADAVDTSAIGARLHAALNVGNYD